MKKLGVDLNVGDIWPMAYVKEVFIWKFMWEHTIRSTNGQTEYLFYCDHQKNHDKIVTLQDGYNRGFVPYLVFPSQFQIATEFKAHDRLHSHGKVRKVKQANKL